MTSNSNKEGVGLTLFELIFCVYFSISVIGFVNGMWNAIHTNTTFHLNSETHVFEEIPLSNDCDQLFTRPIEYIFPAHALACVLLTETK